MKNFKLNAFEKFVIRNKKVLYIFILIAFFVSVIIFSHLKAIVTVPTDTFILAVPTLVIFLYIELLPIIKNAKITNAYRNLNIDLSLDGAIRLADASNPRDFEFSPTFHSNKAIYLICAGKFGEAEEELKLIFQTFDSKKLSPSVLFDIHVNYALIKIQSGDENAFHEQLKIVEGYYEKIKRKASMYISKDTLESLILTGEANFSAYSENFEQKVLDHIKFFGGKEKKKIDLCDYFFGYSLLFTYFARFENTEKAVYYANEIIKIGNDSLFEYRKAKEYLENANKCN